jgi:anaerobic dimethyl sulfoxide reductase subunit B
MAKQLGFYFDSTACIGCRACQVACKDKNDLVVGQTWRQVVEVSGGAWTAQENGTWTTNTFAYYLSLGCQHCENPLCVQVCPTSAMTKRADGTVVVNQDQCIGCRFCEWACPYGSPQFSEAKGVMTKCNFCEDYLAQGKNPACVDACVMRALDFGEIADLRGKYGLVDQVDPLPTASITHPSIVLKPHNRSQAGGNSVNLTLDKGGTK